MNTSTGVRNYVCSTLSDLDRSGVINILNDLGVSREVLWMELLCHSTQKLAMCWEVELDKQELAAAIKAAVISELCFQHPEDIVKISISDNFEIVMDMTDELHWYITSVNSEIDELIAGSNRLWPLW